MKKISQQLLTYSEKERFIQILENFHIMDVFDGCEKLARHGVFVNKHKVNNFKKELMKLGLLNTKMKRWALVNSAEKTIEIYNEKLNGGTEG